MIDRYKYITETRKNFIRLDMNEGMNNKFSMYPEIYPLYDSLSEKYGLGNDYFLASNGSDSAIRYVFQTYLDGRKTIVYPFPTFGMIPVFIKMFDGGEIKILYSYDMKLDIKELMNYIPFASLVYISNPNQPTGTIIKPDDIRNILDVCEEQDVKCLIDEAYYPYYNVSYIDKIKDYSCLIISRTFSKFYGLAGIRVGFLVSNPKNIKKISSYILPFELNNFSIAYAIKTLQLKEHDKYLDDFVGWKKYIKGFCKKNNLKLIDTFTNFLYIDMGTYRNAIDCVKWMRNNNILIKNVDVTHKLLSRCIRFSIGNKKDMEFFMEKLLEYKGLL